MLNVLMIPLLWLMCWLSVMLHELGHAIGFRLGSGKGPWRVFVGSGPKLFKVGRLTLMLFPFGGYFIPDDEAEPKSKKGKLLMLAGGPLVSLLLTVLFGILRFLIFAPDPSKGILYDMLVYLSAYLLIFNLFQFLFTAIPLRYRIICRGTVSDGMQFVHLLKQKDDQNNTEEQKLYRSLQHSNPIGISSAKSTATPFLRNRCSRQRSRSRRI